MILWSYGKGLANYVDLQVLTVVNRTIPTDDIHLKNGWTYRESKKRVYQRPVMVLILLLMSFNCFKLTGPMGRTC